jgi:hypothetical protein
VWVAIGVVLTLETGVVMSACKIGCNDIMVTAAVAAIVCTGSSECTSRLGLVDGQNDADQECDTVVDSN